MRRAALAVVLLAAACARQEPAPAPASRLEELVRQLPALPPCDKVIPQEWSSSWPVPVKEKGSLRYRVFFFGRDGDPGKGFVFHEPQGLALFTPSGEVRECRKTGGAPRALTQDGWQPAGTLDEIVERSRLLYAAAEQAARLFESGKPLSAADKKSVAEFASAFASLSRPGHAAAYRALSPEFWAWIEANGGRAPAAKPRPGF